ncbi:hypothetical protein RIVM261_077240 [Rivularia sp. IAM M-261]|nr:hypothetical protein RIVM261_077240 [Rivularia sp. IAM M-261]
MEEKLQIEIAFKILSEVQDKIKMADTKASFLIGINLFLLSLTLGSLSLHRQTIISLASKGFHCGLHLILAILLFLLSLGLLLNSIFMAITASSPRLNSQSNKTSVTYFCHIADTNLEEYKNTFINLSLSDAVESLIYQIHDNSIIAKTKFARVKQSYFILKFALFTAICSQLINFTLSLII